MHGRSTFDQSDVLVDLSESNTPHVSCCEFRLEYAGVRSDEESAVIGGRIGGEDVVGVAEMSGADDEQAEAAS